MKKIKTAHRAVFFYILSGTLIPNNDVLNNKTLAT